MKFTLGLKQLPFRQDPRQIIYVESYFHGLINKLIMCHYKEICSYFSEAGYEFCYIPWFGRSEEFSYYVPYRRHQVEKVVMKSDFILDYMVHPENREKIGPSLLYYHPDCFIGDFAEAESRFFGITIDDTSFEQSSDLRFVLQEIISDIEKRSKPSGWHRKVSDIVFDIEDIKNNCSHDSYISNEGYSADFFFDSESKQLLDEIWERVEKLKLRGISTYMVKQMINDNDKMLSRLRITKEYSIFLPDYKNIEIKMTPLPKAVFLLFLNHPEGIIFKHLPDYQEELLDFYKKVKGPLLNISTAKESIEDVTNPLSNSINEKCARIREAFVSQFDEHLAKYYYVDGKRGEPKKILLPRELVKWE